MTTPDDTLRFAQLGLPDPVLQAVTDAGYDVPSPIQARSIPPLLDGRDVLGQAQTGTGKTAAFALPVLARVDVAQRHVQALVLTPTRELAIQVAEAMQRYARHLPGFHVLPVYGGQPIGVQLKHLKRGAHVVVGTPGRVIDHLDRQTLDLSEVDMVVLDEADEMLRMGFIDDVDRILEATPPDKQVALFSATMPGPIAKIARRHMKDAEEVRIEAKTSTVEAIDQSAVLVQRNHKVDALVRVLEATDYDGVLVFVRTKSATLEVAERLEARGFSCGALNGDMTQAAREQTVARLKDGRLELVVATDVAARGLDVDRITHVINLDIPYDTEAYVHRIGRTGRAGRKGEAILFVQPREKRLLKAIENATKQPIPWRDVPSADAVADQRIARFKQSIAEALAEQDVAFFEALVEKTAAEQETSIERIAAALAWMAQEDRPLRPQDADLPPMPTGKTPRNDRDDKPGRTDRGPRPDQRFDTYQLAVGASHGASPKHIVGAIANEAGLDGDMIGRIDIRDQWSLVDLPPDMPRDVFQHLQQVRVCGETLRIRLYRPPHGGHKPGPGKPGKHGKPHDSKKHHGKFKPKVPFHGKPHRPKPPTA